MNQFYPIQKKHQPDYDQKKHHGTRETRTIVQDHQAHNLKVVRVCGALHRVSQLGARCSVRMQRNPTPCGRGEWNGSVDDDTLGCRDSSVCRSQ